MTDDRTNEELLNDFGHAACQFWTSKKSTEVALLAKRQTAYAAVLSRMSSPSHDRAMAEGGWRSIESAPHNGTSFIGLSKGQVGEWIWDAGDFMPITSAINLKLLGASSHWPLEAWQPFPTPTTKEETD